MARKRNGDNLTAEEARVLRQTREEYSRRGGFVRVFPTPDSWELYGQGSKLSGPFVVELLTVECRKPVSIPK